MVEITVHRITSPADPLIAAHAVCEFFVYGSMSAKERKIRRAAVVAANAALDHAMLYGGRGNG